MSFPSRSGLLETKRDVMLACMWQELIGRWGYLAIALATFIEGEIFLVWAGTLAHAGLLSLPLVAVAATFGSLAWGQTWFYVGRSLGRTVIDRRPQWRARVARTEPWIELYGSWSIVAFRFVAGMSIVLPLLIGAGGYSPRRFFVLDGVGALIWASVFACAGFLLGTGLGRFIGRATNWAELLGLALVSALSVWLAAQLVRALVARRRGHRAHHTSV